MKKNYIKLLIIVPLIFIAVLVNAFISGVTFESSVYYIGFWFLILLILKLTVGIAKSKPAYKTDILQIVFIYSITFLLLTYILGFFIGFVRSPYSLSLMGVIQNTIPILFLIVIQELVRYVIIDKGKQCIPVIVLVIITFIAADITIGLNAFPITDGMSIFILIGLLILPAIVNNLLLTYITYKNGYRAPIMYRIIFLLIAVYMVPFFPNFGPYVDSVLAVVFPVILFLKINSFFGKDQPITRRALKMRRFLFWAPMSTVLGVVVILASGLFRFQAVAIASGSMSPNILKGDVVIIEKLREDELHKLEVGNVIAFRQNNILIVHRIIDIYERNNQTIFITHGDYNDEPDNWELNYSNIVGLVRFRVMYIGHPTVWLNERLN